MSTCVCVNWLVNKILISFQWAYLSARWWLTVAAADPLALLRRLETCAGERLVCLCYNASECIALCAKLLAGWIWDPDPVWPYLAF
jgi:hypothetical protein